MVEACILTLQESGNKVLHLSGKAGLGPALAMSKSLSCVTEEGNELGRQQIMQARMQALGARGALVCVPEQCRAWSRQLLNAQQWQRRVHSSAGCEVRACK